MKFRHSLRFRGIITSGYIFDRQIMIDALDFFQNSPMMHKLSSNQLDIIEECGIKMLKLMLSAADQPPFNVVTIQELEQYFKPNVEIRNAACCIVM